MSAKQSHDLPARLEAVRRRIEHWRLARKARSRIPDSLWASAVKMARTYGIHRAARALRLDYYALKKRVGPEAAAAPVRPEGSGVATFLELAAPMQTGSGECTLELEDAGGAKMRVHLKGFEAPDLAALSRSFWNPGP